MKLTTSLFVALITTTFISAQEITGTWQGTLNVQGTKLEIVFHIEKQIDGYTSLMDSPTQGAYGIKTTNTIYENEKLQITAIDLGLFYQATAKNDSITGIFNQNGMPFPLTLVRTEKKTQLRPQEPKAPFPYKIEEIEFTNAKENINLAGTLTLPQKKEKSSAVILIAGSGPND